MITNGRNYSGALLHLVAAVAVFLLVVFLGALLAATIALAVTGSHWLALAGAPAVARASLPRITVKAFGRIATLTQARKMLPVYSWSLPARLSCPSAKATIKRWGARAVCYFCYAFQRGNYLYPNVQAAQQLRFYLAREACRTDIAAAEFSEAMITAIARAGRIPTSPSWREMFRWHDAGDIFAPAYARIIAAICSALPAFRFWVPTREHANTSRDMRAALRALARLPNVAVRVSGLTLNRRPQRALVRSLPVVESAVASDLATARDLARRFGGQVCPVTARNDAHLSCFAVGCQACYDSEVPLIIYVQH